MGELRGGEIERHLESRARIGFSNYQYLAGSGSSRRIFEAKQTTYKRSFLLEKALKGVFNSKISFNQEGKVWRA